jgi:hypothetical protein
MRQGKGVTRARYGLEGAGLSSKVVEIRGGGVAIERGALGSSFTGATFLALVRARARQIPWNRG